ncbi:MAG: discoidin domain-containing protein, partial [Candidatus Gastranaerophilaceae bacterium]
QTVLSCPKNQQGYADFIKKVEYSTDVIPLMTSNTHTDCVITASSQYDTTNVPWKACDNSNIDAACWATLTGVPTGWFKLNFTSPKKAIAIAITSRNSTDANTISPKDFIIEGSNDDINYTFLGSWVNITAWQQNEKRFFAFSNQNTYKYYKISIIANNGATYTGFGEIELFEALNDISPLNLKIDCNLDNPIIINFSKGYNLNGKSNDIGIIQQSQILTELLDNTLTYLAAEKDADGAVKTIKTTAFPSYVLAKQKYSDFNSIPKMYSYTSSYEFTSGYLASASSQTSETYASWKSFDKIPASKWMAAVVGGNQYVQIYFPNRRKAARFGIRAGDVPGQSIKNGYIKGWDGSGWKILVNITNQTNWIAYEMRYFEVSAFYDCSKFKLEITDINNMADYTAVAEFEIYELAHCYVIPENKMYLFNPETNNYDEKQVVFIGKVFTGNGLVLDARTFAQNGKYRSQETDLTISNIYNFYHNLGLDYKNIKLSGWIKDKINGSIMPWCVDSSIDYTFEINNYGFIGDDCRFTVRTVPTLMQYKDLSGTNRSITSNVSLILEIERSFE